MYTLMNIIKNGLLLTSKGNKDSTQTSCSLTFGKNSTITIVIRFSIHLDMLIGSKF